MVNVLQVYSTKIIDKAKAFIDDVGIQSPDDARRKRLLNILLLAVGAAAVIGVLFTVSLLLAPPFSMDVVWLLVSSIIFILFSFGLHWLNRRSDHLASWLFLLVFNVLLAFSDSPDQVINGRTLFVFSIPVATASLLLYPNASFWFAGLSSLIIFLLSYATGAIPNIPGIVGFFVLALVSWVASSSLEDALNDLRQINAELDQRVADRTRELSESLAREAAQASQRQAILQGIADGVMVFDKRGTVVLVNPAITHLLDVPLDQVLRQRLEDFLSTDLLDPADRERLTHTLGASDITVAPIRIRWGPKTLSVHAAPVKSPKGEIVGSVAVFRDFTREAEVEEMKNAFVAMVSHELRTPLNAILGYSEMLRDGFYGEINKNQYGAADRILKNSRRLLDIVSDLLDKAQIEAGRLKLDIAPCAIADLDDAMHSVMDNLSREKGLALVSTFDANLPNSIQGDSHRLQQVLVNLVNNAVKFTVTGGIKVQYYRVGEDYWAFDVTDTGPGIPLEAQRYIFDPFRQVDGTVTRKHGGIGLGLSIVKRLIDMMGGRIFLKSALGEGSTFSVVLPVESPAKQANQ
jgi:PAS domain S-box-containing protein